MNAAGMKALIEAIAKPLADHPEAVKVTAEERDGITAYRLSVHPDDAGKIIGKNGRTAKAIRTVVQAATEPGEKLFLDIM